MNEKPPDSDLKAVVIGASAGAVDALLQILPKLPANYPLPVLIVIHLSPQVDSMLAAVLRAHCKLAVKEAEDTEKIRPGCAYLAPPNYHLLVEPDFHLSLSSDEPVLYSRPSIDVLFESAADAFGDNLIGVILTGANADGARGLASIERAGGKALVQDPASAEAAAMPAAALAACSSARCLDLSAITRELMSETIPSFQ